jgi:hypothetical protein
MVNNSQEGIVYNRAGKPMPVGVVGILTQNAEFLILTTKEHQGCHKGTQRILRLPRRHKGTKDIFFEALRENKSAKSARSAREKSPVKLKLNLRDPRDLREKKAR